MISAIPYRTSLSSNRIVALFVLLLGIGITTTYAQPFKANAAITNEEGFDIQLQIDKADEGMYHLAASIDLAEGSYFIQLDDDTRRGLANFVIQERQPPTDSHVSK